MISHGGSHFFLSFKPQACLLTLFLTACRLFGGLIILIQSNLEAARESERASYYYRTLNQYSMKTTIVGSLSLSLLLRVVGCLRATRIFSMEVPVRSPLKSYRFSALRTDIGFLENANTDMLGLIIQAAACEKKASSGQFRQEGHLDTISIISSSLDVWREALEHGHLPEFPLDDASIWPDRTLVNELSDVFNSLELPYLTGRHAELVPAVLKSLLELAIDFQKRIDKRRLEKAVDQEQQATDEDDYSEYYSYDDEYDPSTSVETPLSEVGGGIMSSDDDDFRSELASSLAKQFASAWAPPLGGLASLDELYGPGHGLLSPGGQQDVGGGAGSGRGGFGLFDGVWRHTGWMQMKELQKRLRDMEELRRLIRSLGRRLSVDGDIMRKTPPQREASSSSAPLGVARSPYAPTETSGLRRSDTIEGLLPSEMMLLAAATEVGGDAGAKKRRRLFLAKKAERLLGSYEATGWVDQPSLPKNKPWRYYQKLPTASGGPIIVCLDTSWSMAGPRESLAKAVVLESSIMAAKQNRACYVLAFSGGNNVAECDLSLKSTSKANLVKLLNFLGSSFRGGTDVTGPLLRAIELLEEGDSEWASADLLLVTDGELQTPPVRKELMEKLARMEAERGLEIHGLLVGRNRSIPLSMLCTDWDGIDRVHDFLCKYDPLLVLQQQQQQLMMRDRSGDTTSDSDSELTFAGGSSEQSRPRVGAGLRSASRLYAHTDAHTARKQRSQQHKVAGMSHGVVTKILRRSTPSLFTRRTSLFISSTNYNEDDVGGADSDSAMRSSLFLEDLYKSARAAFTDKLNEKLREIDTARKTNTDASGAMNTQLKTILTKLSSGLVEREVEVKLLLLSALCREHILLLGPPGTGKSELGRRLASISGGGAFFERLLTKYSNPEELFGPLSLSALERDEYIRKTEGYLPSASVAFLDEIFKANSAILNSLLTILNERKFDNGNERVDVPLLAVVAASNELPDSEELDALYDRFLFRRQVAPVSDAGLLDLLLLLGPPLSQVDGDATSDQEEDDLINERTAIDLQQKAAAVQIPIEVAHLLRDLRAYLRDEADPPVYVSDRRLVKAAAMLRVAAATNGRTKVSLLDCLLLQHVLWYSSDDQAGLRDWLWQRLVADSGIQGLVYITEGIAKRAIRALQEIDDSSNGAPPALPPFPVADGTGTIAANNDNDDGTIPGRAVIKSATEEMKAIEELLVKKVVDFKQLAAECRGSGVGGVGSDHIWLSEPENVAIRQQLAPKAEAIAGDLESLAVAIVAMKQSLVNSYLKVDDGSNDNGVVSAAAASSSYDGESASTGAALLEEIWSRYTNKGSAFVGDYDNTSYDSSGKKYSLSAADLALSKKEAQKKLSAEDFKFWKKAQKSGKKKSRDEDDDDDY